MRIALLAASLACLTFSTPLLIGQGETTSAIVGSVSDPSGAALPGATVTVLNADTGSKRAAKTDDAGRFSFPQLKPGSYAVKVEAEGFGAANQSKRVRRPGTKADGQFHA